MGKKNHKRFNESKKNNAARAMKGFEALDALFVNDIIGGNNGGSKSSKKPYRNDGGEKPHFTKKTEGEPRKNFEKRPYQGGKKFDKSLVKERKKSSPRELTNAFFVTEISTLGLKDKKAKYCIKLSPKNNKLGTTEFTYIPTADTPSVTITGQFLCSSKDGSVRNAIFLNKIPEANAYHITSVLPVFKGNLIVKFEKEIDSCNVTCTIYKIVDFFNQEDDSYASLIKYNSFTGVFAEGYKFLDGTEDLQDVEWEKEPFEGYSQIIGYVATKLNNPNKSISKLYPKKETESEKTEDIAE